MDTRYASVPADPAESETLSMHEVSRTETGRARERLAESVSPGREGIVRKPAMYANGKSDGGIVPKKPSNKGTAPKGKGPAEMAEGRTPAKRNPNGRNRNRTQC